MKGALHWAPIGSNTKKVNYISPLPLLHSMDFLNNTQILDIGTGTGTKTTHEYSSERGLC